MVTELASIGSAIIALVALIATLAAWRSERRAVRLVHHYELVAEAEDMLSEHQELLRFHGLDPAGIQAEYGISATELAYLLHSFNASSLSYLLSGKRDAGPLPPGSYRYRMLMTPATQRAFPLVKQFFEAGNLYIVRCEATIRSLKCEQSDEMSSTRG